MLFNINDRGSEELNRLTGTFYASNRFSLIEGELAAAMREVSHLVGAEVMAKAEKCYMEGTDEEFVDAVRLPVALLAVSRWSALVDVSHEDSGRKRKVDDNEKLPFEWMIDRDDRAMRERYYRSLDAMYEYLETNCAELWHKSPVRKLLDESVVGSLEEFESVYPIDHSWYVFYMMQCLVVECQRLEVRKVFGDEAWARVVPPDPDVQPDGTLLYLAQRLAVLGAVVKAVERWSLAVFPLEIARRFSPTYQGNRESSAASADEIDRYLAGLRGQMAAIVDEVHDVVNGVPENVSVLPENCRRNKFFTTL